LNYGQLNKRLHLDAGSAKRPRRDSAEGGTRTLAAVRPRTLLELQSATEATISPYRFSRAPVLSRYRRLPNTRRSNPPRREGHGG
jgi:hypothetical protein